MASIFVVSTHPDDETLFSGGMLAMYAKNGHDVYILETTCFLRNSGAPSVPQMVWKTEAFHIWQGPLPEDL
ncbi:MAG: PIG-L family deacetylase [Desulfobacterales bacterium]